MLDLIDHPSDHGTEFSADEIGAPARSRIHANLLQRHRNQRISDPAPSLRGAQTAGLVSLASARLTSMRWLMIVLLVSVVALLAASAGLAHHIWQEHRKRSRTSRAPGPTEDVDVETEETP